nr:MAG TPA: hypothetical protein [Caudoviricetes sp.]
MRIIFHIGYKADWGFWTSKGMKDTLCVIFHNNIVYQINVQ